MIEERLNDLLYLLQANPLITGAIGGVLLVLCYFKPKSMFKLVAFCVFLSLAFYFITLFVGTLDTGSKQKDRMIYKSRDVLGE